ncbi:MAG: hypothetical protein QM778_06180 [Myxococcales bacterium]
MEVFLHKSLLAASFALATTMVIEAAPAQASDNYQITQVGTEVPTPGLNRTTFTVSAGPSALETFHVVRVRQASTSHHGDPPVILISPFSFPAEFWEITSVGAYADTYAARVASAGYDVWLVDSRGSSIAPGSCESGAVDCSPMGQWGIDLSVEDAMFVQRLVKSFTPNKKPVIGGLSGGSTTAIATINKYPSKFSGLFMWEGTIFTEVPAIHTRNANFCAQDEARMAAGNFADPSVQGFKTLFQLAEADPNGPSPIPVFPPGTTNLQALLFAFTMPDPNNPLNFTDDFVRMIGDPFTTTLAYADIDRVFGFGSLIPTYAPVPFIRDSHCAMGNVTGYADRWADRLDKFHGDALVFVEGHGFNQMMFDTASLLTKADVTIDYHAEFGESDRYFNRDWVTVAVNPLLAWLAGVKF